MKFKGTVKNAGRKPNFWGNSKNKLPEEFKETIYHQYYSNDTLYFYCDCSMDLENNMISIACSYVQDGTVAVEGSIVYPPSDCKGKNIYGELQAIMSGLLHFERHMYKLSKYIVIYSDVDHITNILNSEVTFEKIPDLKELQVKLTQSFKYKQLDNPHLNISIKYLSNDLKTYNPFQKSAHNAARRLLQKQVETNY